MRVSFHGAPHLHPWSDIATEFDTAVAVFESSNPRAIGRRRPQHADPTSWLVGRHWDTLSNIHDSAHAPDAPSCFSGTPGTSLPEAAVPHGEQYAAEFLRTTGIAVRTRTRASNERTLLALLLLERQMVTYALGQPALPHSPPPCASTPAHAPAYSCVRLRHTLHT